MTRWQRLPIRARTFRRWKARCERPRAAGQREMSEKYVPQDRLSLWMLTDPERPVPVGEISLALSAQSVALRYGAYWLSNGFALSEDLPLIDRLHVPKEKKEAVGAIEDARPDRWGERVIRKFERSPRLSLLEYLLFAGSDRYGALGVSQALDQYQPWGSSPAPSLGDLPAMQEVVRKILANEPVGEVEQRLLRPGVSLGGARPKSLIEIDGEPWLVKFGEGEDENTPLIEHATMTLAAKSGIVVAPTRALPVRDRHAVAVRRFDRAPSCRVHALSAHVALRAVGEEYGYPQLSQQLRRMARPKDIVQMQAQLFRRMVFNILMDNTDDHEKNHALLRQRDGSWALSPAFDVVPSMSGLGYQAMSVGRDGSDSTIENALSGVAAFGLKLADAKTIVKEVASVVEHWHRHFQECGVSAEDLEILAQYLDNDRLGVQRREYAPSDGAFR
jgi:serine/threonine-protein kinase HipA